jgi:acyl-CoA thioester hydrolase
MQRPTRSRTLSEAEQRGAAETRGRFPHFLAIPTRWMDNDIYGHVNNVVYYSYVDTVINRYLISAGGFDPHNDPTVGITPETRCWFKKSITYPQVIDAGLRVGRLGSSSVRYEVGLFIQGDDALAALAHFVHVFVDRTTMRPAPIPPRIRDALALIVTDQSSETA